MPPPTNAKSTSRFMRTQVPAVPSVHTTDEPCETRNCVDSPRRRWSTVARTDGASARGAAGSRLARDLVARDERGIDLLEHDLAVDHALADVGAARQVVHDVEQDL